MSQRSELPKISLLPHRSDARLAELIARQVLSRYPSGSVLDIGCGDGVVGRWLPKVTTYRGLDLADACIYDQSHDNPSIRYVDPAQLEQVLQSEGQFDTVLLLDVLEHTRRFTPLFEQALGQAKRHVVVSLPNELFFFDRLRYLGGREIPAHSLDLVPQPEGFKHQFMINIAKARALLEQVAAPAGFDLVEEVQQPLVAKQPLLQPLLAGLRAIGSAQLWSMGSIFVFARR
ncbi:MAG: methyltransferase domain-containing protein [Synechococcaceae cyanobacterium ELA445]